MELLPTRDRERPENDAVIVDKETRGTCTNENARKSNKDLVRKGSTTENGKEL